ncbi:hypothetical protein B0H16DRAFT_1029545 [Mycena metata]|uniref:DUF6699 domain-containing protein n=1 Tax=Mycena metata TaxID=1033252 RepID=A0AAD7IF33_9AGAR|nr:hypothetical protein B0H16DRAFT_1029545 [Mycena metata]
MQGVRPSRLETMSPAPLWPLLESCWAENPEDRPIMISTVQLLQSEPIAAPVKESRPDWDETYSARFRRSIQQWPLVPSVPEIERRITRYNARQPTTSLRDLGPYLLPRPPAPFKDSPAEVFSGPLSTLAIDARPPAPSISHTVPLPSWLPPGVWPDPTTLHIRPSLSCEAPSPTFQLDLSSTRFALELEPPGRQELSPSGFYPPLTFLQIVHPRIPYWPARLTSPAELTAGGPMPAISVYDVLKSLHRVMHEPISHADWQSLNGDVRAITKAFTHRCGMEAARAGVLPLRDREEQERNKGVKRVDFLLGKTVFIELFKAPEDPDGCLQVVTA